MRSSPPAAGPTPSWFTRLQNWAYEERAYFFLLIAVLLIVDAGYWILSHFLALVHDRPAGIPLEPTDVTAEIGLALGTLALAAAAIIQAKAAGELTSVSRAQADATRALVDAASRQATATGELTKVSQTQADAAIALTDAASRQATAVREQTAVTLRPSLSAQFRGVSVRIGQTSEIRELSTGDLLAIGGEDSALYVHNAGPGVAWDVQIAITPLGPLPQMDGRALEPAQRCAPMLGPGESSQVAFPGPLLQELWPGTAVGAKFAVIFEIEAQEATASSCSMSGHIAG